MKKIKTAEYDELKKELKRNKMWTVIKFEKRIKLIDKRSQVK